MDWAILASCHLLRCGGAFIILASCRQFGARIPVSASPSSPLSCWLNLPSVQLDTDPAHSEGTQCSTVLLWGGINIQVQLHFTHCRSQRLTASSGQPLPSAEGLLGTVIKPSAAASTAVGSLLLRVQEQRCRGLGLHLP